MYRKGTMYYVCKGRLLVKLVATTVKAKFETLADGT
jgi:hypothetical protein